MDLFRNNKTGKYFIYIADAGEHQVILVNPYNEVEAWERRLFDEIMEGQGHDLLSRGLVTEMQIKTYRKKMSRMEIEREIEERKKSWEDWEEMTLKQRMEKIEKALRKMSFSARQEFFESVATCGATIELGVGI